MAESKSPSTKKRVLKWFGRAIKLVSVTIALAVLGTAVWWWNQPVIPGEQLQCSDEMLASEDLRDEADAALDRMKSVAEELRLPSVSIAISVDGELRWAAALGTADLANKEVATLQTRYRTGSVAKSITGFAAAKLVREGKLELDGSIHDYVPEFPAKRWEITVRQLGSHTGGIRHYADPGQPGFVDEQFSSHHYQSVEESLTIFRDDPLIYEPGTAFVYSTHGFTLLSAAMESAAGEPFPDLIDRLVWKEVEMRDTCLDDLTKATPDRAIPYLALGGRAIHVDGPDPSYKWAGGGMLSTPSDLVKLGSAMFSEGFVTTEKREDVFVPQPLADGSKNPQEYTMGWRNSRETELVGSKSPIAVMHHGGQCPGGSSFILLIPDGKVAAAVMTNVSIRNPWPMREAVYRIAGEFRSATRKQRPSEP